MLALPMMGQGWMKTYGGVGDQAAPMAVTAKNDNGYYFVASQMNQFYDIYTLNTDFEGNIIFEKELNLDIETFYPSDVKPLPDGGFIIVGTGYVMLQYTPYIIRIDATGSIIWEKTIAFDLTMLTDRSASSILVDSNGDFYITCSTFISIDNKALLVKADGNGTLIWEKTISPEMGDYNSYTAGKIVLKNGDIFIFGNAESLDTINHGFNISIMKLNINGELIWDKYYGTYSFVDYASGVAICPNGDLILSGNKYDNSIQTAYAMRINDNGDVIWIKEYEVPTAYDSYSNITSSFDGGYFICGSHTRPTSNRDIVIIKIDENGDVIWRKQHDFSDNEGAISIFQLFDGSLRVAGEIQTLDNGWDVFLAKADMYGSIYSSALTGRTHLDPQPDCLPDPAEPGLANCLVQAQGAFNFATLTDSSGYFTLPIDTGTYEVTVTPPGPYWEVCNSPATVNVAAFYDTTLLDFPVSAVVDCPYLEVDISVPFLRRCFDNTYSVHYCNYGTVAAEDATITVTLDPYLTYQSSSIPFSNQSGNTLSFDLGDVAVNECGSFYITALLDCDSTIIGQTHCTEAHVFPDSLCLPTDPEWDGSSIELSVDCVGDSVIFTITNTGTGDMAQPLDYIIIEDQIVLLQGNFDLDAGQSMTVAVEANGTTFHLEAQQSPVHPSGTFSVGSTIEGCGGWLSLGFFSQWANGNPNPFVDVDCQANVGSYDPNEKVAFPAGFTEAHLIEPGQDIEYLLRFQNTGTDTAFKVVVVDVLPPELDLATVRPGASSHPYVYSVTPEGWLVFTFENIMLPDSNVNEIASHGFVRFKVSQKPGLGLGNEILNTALIYFDFNAPIRTNTTVHRIGQVFPWSPVGTKTVLHQKATFRILPNPLTDSAMLQVEGIEPGALRLTLTDVSGKVLRVQESSGTSFEFFRNDLASGMYFFKIEKGGKWMGSGKLMVR